VGPKFAECHAREEGTPLSRYSVAMRRRRGTAPLRSIRFRPWVRAQIERLVKRTGRGFSEVTQDLLEEALRIRVCPGIYFADEPAGRVAKVTGTGLGVWEVIRDYLDEGRDRARLRRSLPQLSDAQVEAALRYYSAWPEEIDELVAENVAASAAP
jgi:uncharacterized protein (DUF433 family)